MFNKLRDVSAYEAEIRKIKREHFKRVNDLENENHSIKDRLATIESEFQRKLKDVEIKYEQEILALKHQVKLEMEHIDLKKEKTVFEAEREVGRLKEEFSSDKYGQMEALLEKEKDTLRTILNIVIQRLPEARQIDFSAKGDLNLLTSKAGEDGKKE